MIDFLVIGGGIAGISAAARLSELGSVTVLEAEDALGYHASGRSAALYEANYGKPSTVALNEASYDYHVAAGVLSPRGFLIVGRKENADLFAADVTELGMNIIDLQDAFDLIPILDPQAIDRAAYVDGAQDIDTDKLLQSFATTARRNGATIVTKASVTGTARTQKGWIVTAGETFEARQIVNAAGAWADQIR